MLLRNFTRFLFNSGKWTQEEKRKLFEAANRINIEEKQREQKGRLPSGTWKEISSYVGGRSGSSCQVKYKREVSKKGIWTIDDKQRLAEAVKLSLYENQGKLPYGTWTKISKAVGGRYSSLCRGAWLDSLNPGLRHGKWTPDEDERLKSLVEELGTGKWTLLAEKLANGRTGVKCRQRWLDISSNRNVGKWTTEEVNKLIQGHKEYGNQWSRIAAEFVKTRSPRCCFQKWQTMTVSSEMKGKNWSEDEDQRLMKGHEKYGNRWAFISREYVLTRTGKQCATRWSFLQKRYAR